MVKKVWHYWGEDIRFGIGEIYNTETKLFFENYPKYANYALKRLFGDEIDISYSYYYSFEQFGNSRILRLSMLSKSPFDYIKAPEFKNKENSEIKIGAAFENMISYAPFFNTIINKCYKAICDKFDCKFDGTGVDGTKIYVL